MHTKPVIDHIGNKHESIQAMCKYWGISRNTYISRMRSGNFTVERALTLPVQSFGNNIKPAIDHLGNKYPSQLELCKAYNIRTSMLINRLNSGMTMEQALTTPIQPHTKPARDHLGKEYSSQAEMCRAYKVPLDVYRVG